MKKQVLTSLPPEIVGKVAGIVAHVLDVLDQVLLFLLPLLLVPLVKSVVRVHFVFAFG